jgi:hypothetical protein
MARTYLHSRENGIHPLVLEAVVSTKAVIYLHYLACSHRGQASKDIFAFKRE